MATKQSQPVGRICISCSDRNADWLKRIKKGYFQKRDLEAHKLAYALHLAQRRRENASSE